MTVRARVVMDTNALVSRLLLPDSVPGQAVCKAVGEADLLVSEAALYELADVLARAKGLRKNNFTFWHPVFGAPSAATDRE